jgi:polyisoprenoid-binding protein YceI
MAWVIDPAHTTIGFSARHMGLSTVRGRFTRFEGTIEYDPEDVLSSKARLEIDVASIDTGQEQRDQHLRSSDFFEVETYPKMVFVSKEIGPKRDDTYSVIGDLTIKDVTHEVELTYEHAGEGIDPYGNRRVGGTLNGSISRSDWGLKWNVALETGGWLVSDKIKLEIEVQATENFEAVEERAGAEAKVSA